MPTENPRLNLTLNDDIMKSLTLLAKKSKLSVATVAKELLMDGLEINEDVHFSRISDKRFKETKNWHSHEDAWK